MRGSIFFAATLLATVAFAPASQASPLMSNGGIVNAAAETSIVEQARHVRHHRKHWRHYGWSRGHHYGWRHRKHPHRY